MDRKTIPFKTYVYPGTSSFSVSVTAPPLAKCKFTNLIICPDFYSQKAAQLDLASETEPGPETVLNFHLTQQFLDNFYPTSSRFALAEHIPALGEWMKQFNAHFDSSKPRGTLYPPVFIDWIHVNENFKVDPASYTSKLYRKPPTPDNVLLPANVEHLPGLNALPLPDLDLSDTRLRLHIAPNVKVHFSTDGHLRAMGFGSHQIGKRRAYNQFIFENPTAEFLTIEAESWPQVPISAIAGKVMLTPVNDHLTSPSKVINLSKKQFGDNVTLAEEVTKSLDELSSQSNVDVKMSYEDNVFKFTFPENSSLRVAFHCPPQLALRLGYGMVFQIHRNSVSRKPNQDVAKADAKTMAEMLVQDTGIVAVRQSNNLITEVAHLFPTQCGTLALQDDRSSAEFHLPRFRHYVHSATFELQTYNQHNPVPLQWVSGAYVSGVLAIF